MQYHLLSKNSHDTLTLSNDKEVGLLLEKNLLIELGAFQFIPEKPEKELFSTHRYWYQSDSPIRPIKNITSLLGTYFIALDAHMRGLNHSHFIQQIFLSFLVAKHYGVNFKKIPILINRLDETKKKFLNLLGDFNFIEVAFQPNTAIVVENALFPHTLFRFYTAQELALLFSNFLATLSLPKSLYSDKIYLSRKDVQSRKAINEDEIIKYMQKRDFSIVELGNLSPLDQISTFANAKTIIGPHGAGGVNLYFAQNEVRFLEMFSGGRIVPCHANIAYSKNCQYQATLSQNESQINSPFTKDNDYMLDKDLLEQALDTPFVQLESAQNPNFFKNFSYSEEEIFMTGHSPFSSENTLKSLSLKRIEGLHVYLPKGLAYFYQSFTYLYKQDFAKARDYCQKACDIEENNIYFYKQLLRILKLQLDAKSILMLTAKIKNLFPWWGEPYYQLSLVYFTSNDNAKALHFAKIAQELEPSSKVFQTHLQTLSTNIQ